MKGGVLELIPSQDMFVKFRVVNGVKFLARNHDVFKLDEVGETIWNLIDGESTIEEIADKVSTKYNVSRDVVLPDVQEFIKELDTNNLLEV